MSTTLPRPTETPEEFLTGPEPPRQRLTPFASFFFWLFLIPAIFYLAAIPLVRLPGYERWGPSHWGPMLDFNWKTQNEDADVVLFGDSSAFLGIDPRLVDRQLGIKSVVLPNTVGSLPVLRDQALDFYLAHNTRPRLIVLYFTAWDLDYGDSSDTRLFEGEEMLLRHGTPAQIAQFALKHPIEIPAFPLRSYTSVGPAILKSVLHGVDRGAETAAALGHVDDRENFPSLQPGCSIPKRFVAANRADSVRGLAERYRDRGFNVAVYLAPIPSCSNSGALTNRTGDGLALRPPVVLPPTSFKQDGFYAHMQPESVPTSSRLFAEWLAPRLRK